MLLINPRMSMPRRSKKHNWISSDRHPYGGVPGTLLRRIDLEDVSQIHGESLDSVTMGLLSLQSMTVTFMQVHAN